MWKDKKSGLKLGFLKKFPKKSRKILFYLFFILINILITIWIFIFYWLWIWFFPSIFSIAKYWYLFFAFMVPAFLFAFICYFFIFWKNFKTEKQSYIHLWLFILIFQITILSLDYITYEISESMQNNQIVSIN